MSDSLQLHWLQDPRFPCPSLSPGVCSNSWPMSQWCHITISSCPHSFPASGSCPKSQFFATGDQNIGASTSASVLPMNIWGWFSFQTDWFDFLDVQGTLKNLQHHNLKASILQCSSFFMVQLSHPYMTTGKIIALTRWTFVGKLTSLFFNTLSRFVIAFLPKSKDLLVSWLQRHPQWFWSPRNENLSLFPLFPLLFAMKS